MQNPTDLEDIENELRDELLYNRINRISLIDHMKENKDFQNPKIIQQTVEYFKIDGNGTQFDPVYIYNDIYIIECL